MKIAYTSNSFRRWCLEETIETLSKLGYDGIQISANRPHALPEDMAPEARREIANLLRQKQLDPYMIDTCHVTAYQHIVGHDALRRRYPEEGEPMWGAQSSTLRWTRIDYTKRCIDLAVDLGSKMVLINSGEPMMRPDISRRHVIEGWKECLKYAEKKNVQLVIELFPLDLFGRPEEAYDIIQEIGSPILGVNFDVGHMYCFDIDIPASVKKLGKLIKSVHFEDIMYRKHFHLVPGDGEIDLREFLESLLSIGYDGYLCLEVYTEAVKPEEAAKRGIDYTRKLLRELGVQ